MLPAMRVLTAMPAIALALASCGGDARVASPAPVPQPPADASFAEAATDDAPDAADARLDAGIDAGDSSDASDGSLEDPDAEDSPLEDADADSDVVVPDDPPSCTASTTVIVQAQLQGLPLTDTGVVVTSHCAGGRLFRKTATDALGAATIEVPVGGLVTAACDRLNSSGPSRGGSLPTIGGVEAGGTLPFDCSYSGLPHGRSPAPPLGGGFDYVVELEPVAGAARYEIRGNAGMTDSALVGPLPFTPRAAPKAISSSGVSLCRPRRRLPTVGRRAVRNDDGEGTCSVDLRLL